MIHESLSGIRIMPIRNLLLRFGERPNEQTAFNPVEFKLLEADSTASIIPIRRNSGSSLKTVAYKCEISAFISQNQYGDGYNLDIDNITRGEVIEIALLLAGLPGQAAGGQQVWKFSTSNSFDRWASCEIATVEFRPRLNVRAGCMLQSSVFTSSNPIDISVSADGQDFQFNLIEFTDWQAGT